MLDDIEGRIARALEALQECEKADRERKLTFDLWERARDAQGVYNWLTGKGFYLPPPPYGRECSFCDKGARAEDRCKVCRRFICDRHQYKHWLTMNMVYGRICNDCLEKWMVEEGKRQEAKSKKEHDELVATGKELERQRRVERMEFEI